MGKLDNVEICESELLGKWYLCTMSQTKNITNQQKEIDEEILKLIAISVLMKAYENKNTSLEFPTEKGLLKVSIALEAKK